MSNPILMTLRLLLGLSAYQKDKVVGGMKHASKFDEEIRSSPESITIASKKLVLTIYL